VFTVPSYSRDAETNKTEFRNGKCHFRRNVNLERGTLKFERLHYAGFVCTMPFVRIDVRKIFERYAGMKEQNHRLGEQGRGGELTMKFADRIPSRWTKRFV